MTKPYLLNQIEPYIFNQNEAVDNVIINHGKNKLCPQVILLDEYGEVFETEIKYLTPNTLQLKMNMPVKFTVYIY